MAVPFTELLGFIPSERLDLRLMHRLAPSATRLTSTSQAHSKISLPMKSSGGGECVLLYFHSSRMLTPNKQHNSQRYPVLARMAKDYLAIQGSSVPSERAFSSAGLDKTLLRNRMKADLFEALQILRSAYKAGILSAQHESENFVEALIDMDAELAIDEWDFE
jgi:hypothetical protein